MYVGNVCTLALPCFPTLHHRKNKRGLSLVSQCECNVGVFRASLLACSLEGGLYWWSDVLQGVAITLQGCVNLEEGVVFSVNPIVDGRGRDECLVVSLHASMWVISPTIEVGVAMGRA